MNGIIIDLIGNSHIPKVMTCMSREDVILISPLDLVPQMSIVRANDKKRRLHPTHKNGLKVSQPLLHDSSEITFKRFYRQSQCPPNSLKTRSTHIEPTISSAERVRKTDSFRGSWLATTSCDGENRTWSFSTIILTAFTTRPNRQNG